MQDNDITDETRNHYDNLISKKGKHYFDERWMSNPVANSQYYQTLTSIRQLFKSRIKKNKNDVLEIGSGTGTWTGLCIQIAKSVTLFDISKEFLTVAQDVFKNEPRVREYICGDFVKESGMLMNKKYDLIFSGRALEYMSDKSAVIDHCFEHLEPKGHLVIVTKNPQWRDKIRNGNAGGIHRAQIYWKDLKVLYEEAGFIDVVIRPAALGSYYFPYNNFIGIKICNIIHMIINQKDMCKRFDSITESYVIDGRKPG